MLAPIDRQLAPGGLAIFGELHGTMEVPAFVARAADHAASPPGVTLFAERHECGWDGAFQLGELTPSMPLVR